MKNVQSMISEEVEMSLPFVKIHTVEYENHASFGRPRLVVKGTVHGKIFHYTSNSVASYLHVYSDSIAGESYNVYDANSRSIIGPCYTSEVSEESYMPLGNKGFYSSILITLLSTFDIEQKSKDNAITSLETKHSSKKNTSKCFAEKLSSLYEEVVMVPLSTDESYAHYGFILPCEDRMSVYVQSFNGKKKYCLTLRPRGYNAFFHVGLPYCTGVSDDVENNKVTDHTVISVLESLFEEQEVYIYDSLIDRHHDISIVNRCSEVADSLARLALMMNYTGNVPDAYDIFIRAFETNQLKKTDFDTGSKDIPLTREQFENMVSNALDLF